MRLSHDCVVDAALLNGPADLANAATDRIDTRVDTPVPRQPCS
jgi:hypothetical protein